MSNTRYDQFECQPRSQALSFANDREVRERAWVEVVCFKEFLDFVRLQLPVCVLVYLQVFALFFVKKYL